MWGRKGKEIADLKRKIRVQSAQLADIKDELKATRYAARTAARLYAEDTRGQRLSRALHACARYRRELALQGRVTRRLSSQLLDATGYQGEPLLPAARQTLGITPKDVAR